MMTASLKYTYTDPKALYIHSQLSLPQTPSRKPEQDPDPEPEPEPAPEPEPPTHAIPAPLYPRLAARRRLTFFPVTFDFWMDFTLMIGRSGCIEKVQIALGL